MTVSGKYGAFLLDWKYQLGLIVRETGSGNLNSPPDF